MTSVFKIRKKIVNFTKFLKFVKIRFITHWYLQSLRIRTTLATVENNSVECEQWTLLRTAMTYIHDVYAYIERKADRRNDAPV